MIDQDIMDFVDLHLKFLISAKNIKLFATLCPNRQL